MGSTMQLLRPVKEHLPLVSWSDLIQMSRAVSVEITRGLKIPMRYGRVDAEPGEHASKELDSVVQMLGCSSMGQLRVGALAPDLKLAIAGDLVNDCENAGQMHLVELPTDEVKNLHHLYQRNPAAFLRDYSRAHVAHSEIGATFSPINGVQL